MPPALLSHVLLLLGAGFLVANVRILVDVVRFFRMRSRAVLTWPSPQPRYYGLFLAMAAMLGLVLLVKLVYLRLPPTEVFGEAMMLTYYGYLVPLEHPHRARVLRGRRVGGRRLPALPPDRRPELARGRRRSRCCSFRGCSRWPAAWSCRRRSTARRGALLRDKIGRPRHRLLVARRWTSARTTSATTPRVAARAVSPIASQDAAGLRISCAASTYPPASGRSSGGTALRTSRWRRPARVPGSSPGAACDWRVRRRPCRSPASW